ncbi:MAG: hypothetical protein IPK82_31260 [Polyangiaceae bacterium]|nr:hypothetical protein [Polyangiaceae bacterium]
MTKDELVASIKAVVSQARAGKLDEAYAGYRAIFSNPAFLEQRPEDQRQALKLMVHAKVPIRETTPVMVEAHRAALMPLTELVSRYGEPVDHELLGMCHVLLGNHDSASMIYRAGLAIERERNPGSDLCGELMKKISLI